MQAPSAVPMQLTQALASFSQLINKFGVFHSGLQQSERLSQL
jgi:hypothetical protein